MQHQCLNSYRLLLHSFKRLLSHTYPLIHIKSHAAFINTPSRTPWSPTSDMFQSSVHDCTQEITAIYFLSPTVEEWCHGFRYSLRTEGRLWKRSQLRFSVQGLCQAGVPLLFLCVGGLVWVSSGYRLVSDPPAPLTLSGEEGTWLSPVWVLSCNAKTVLAGKMLGETAKICVKKTYTSYFPIVKLWTISSGREDCFSAGICKNSHDSERERMQKREQKQEELNKRPWWNAAQNERWRKGRGEAFRMAKITCYHLSYFKENHLPLSISSSCSGVSYSRRLKHLHPLLQAHTTRAIQVHADTCFNVQRVRQIQAVLGVLLCALSSADELMRRSVLYHSFARMTPGQGWYWCLLHLSLCV